jgi:phosphocarrier protein FPr
MKELTLLIHNPTGLHARPAKILANTAKKHKSDIVVFNGAKKANAKSMVSILTLGVEPGTTVRIEINGEDEELAAQVIEDLVNSGLGEETHAPAPATPAPVAVAPIAPAADHVDGTGLIKGIPAAPGIGIGPVYLLQHAVLTVDETFTTAANERARLNDALEQAKVQLTALHDQMKTTAASEAAIFDAHLEILDDPDLLDSVQQRIDQQSSVSRAWQASIEERAKALAALSDPLLAARATDIHDVGYRVLRLLVNSRTQDVPAWPAQPVVVIGRDLSPSDTAALPRDRVLAFCTAGGGPTAHSAIIARALGIPAIVGAGEAVLSIANGTIVIVDGQAGTIVVEPDEQTLMRAREAQQRFQAKRAADQARSADPAITTDGHRVEIVANIGGVKDAQKANASGAEGVGLLRTEFLFLDRTVAPTEQEQFEVYRDVAIALEQKPVIIRTLDIGGDKPLPYIQMPHEDNPFLGVRGIRLCLERPQLLREQLRAILKASEFGRLRIMFPMVADLSEVRAARAMIEEIRAELYLPAVEVGIMIEVPAAALMADAFAPEVDFFSIGTNDLTQYTLAMDRMHPTLATKADGLHPAVLRLIAKTVEAAHAAGKWVGICGELGADPQAVPILVGLGVDELSVSVPSIPGVKAQVRALNFVQAQQLAQAALKCGTAVQVRAEIKL